jgi:hypothetical protein
MISSEVQRTLVKSPPELWAELSDPALLARHLGELGEIRITRVEPEQTVEWEAENTNGTVEIKPSGWGTRVTLTVTRELTEDEAEPPRHSDAQPGADAGAPSAWHAEPAPAGEIDGDPAWLAEGVASFTPQAPPAADVEREAAAEICAEGGVEAETEPRGAETLPDPSYVWLIDDEPEPRRGFFGRLFRRRRRPTGTESEAIVSAGEMDPVSELSEEIAPGEAGPQAPAAWEDKEALASSAAGASLAPAPEPWQPDASSDPVLDPAPVDEGSASAHIAQTDDAQPEPVPAPDTSSELKAAAQAAQAAQAAEAEVTAVLTSVLDRLGAAHHRPFSRS